MQSDDISEILVRFEAMKPEEFNVQDYRELMQRFQDWNQQKSPYAERAKVVLRRIADRFSPDQVRIQ